MIEPEIGQLPLQLTFAINGAQRFGLLELTQRFLRQFARLGTHTLRRMRRGVHLLAILFDTDSQALGDDVRLRICGEKRLRIKICRRQLPQTGFERGFGNFFGVKLALDPVLESDAFDALQISRTRAITQPVQCVQDGFVFG